jgi:hypothetical protein
MSDDLVQQLEEAGHSDLAVQLKTMQLADQLRDAGHEEAAASLEGPAPPDPNDHLEPGSSTPLFPDAREVDPVVAALDRDVADWGQ